MTSELSTIATVQFGELRLFGKLSMFMPIFPEFRKLVKKIHQRNTCLKRYCQKVSEGLCDSVLFGIDFGDFISRL